MDQIKQAQTKLKTLELWRQAQTTLTHKTLIDREIRVTRVELTGLRRQRLETLRKRN